MEFNKYQTNITEEELNELPQEIKEQFLDAITNVPFIKGLISKDRLYAKDLPRDDEGKIIVDITKPHILEDTDYFRPSAIHFNEYGCYTKLRPNANPNSAYRKWLNEEVRRCWEGYVRPSDGEWIPGDMYFFLNYCPIQLIKKNSKGESIRTIDFPRFFDGNYYRFHYLNQCRKEGHHAMELAKRGAGKAHPYDEIVYTPNGKKYWKDIKVGDYLFGDDGNITQVIDIPFDDIAPIYEIEFSSGEKVRCSEGHLWKVMSHTRGEIIVSTKELINIYKRPRKISSHNPKGYELDCTIPINKGVEYTFKKTKVEPYTFGLMLGDGCFRIPQNKNKAYFTSSDEDFDIYKNYIPYNWIKYNNTKYGYNLNIPEFNEILNSYNLNYVKSEDKFIPDEYKYNSREVRINILKGILDADGTVDNKGRIEIVLSSKQLIEDIKWLCASLGINYTKERIKHTWYYNSNREKVKCLDAYRLSIYSNIPLFNLPRKLKLWNSRGTSSYANSKYKGTKIVNIKYIGEYKAKCVTVDNKSHCYLINKFITTHNSYSAASLLAKRFILGESYDVKKKVQCVVTASERKYIQGANQVLDMFQYYIDFCASNTEFPAQRLTSSLQNMQWTMGYIDVDSGTRKGTLNSVIGITSKDDESKLRGSRGVLYLLEEAGTFPRLLNLYQVLRPSVEDGNSIYGLIYGYGCVTENNKVWTLDGRYISVKDLKKEDGIIGSAYSGIVKNPIGTIITPVEKECLRITLENDNYIECSIDHPILKQVLHTPRRKGNSEKRLRIFEEGFVRADSLKVKDRIVEERAVPVFGTDTLFDARLVGMLIGDGTYGYNNTPRYASQDSELVDYIQKSYDTTIYLTKQTKSNKLYRELRIRNICKNLREIGIYGQTKTSKRLPINYQTLDYDNTRELLAGLFDTDGCIYFDKRNSCISLSQGNIEILKQVKVLLKKFGISCYICENKPSIKEGRKDKNQWYVLFIKGFYNIKSFKENIPILVGYKKEKLEKCYSWFIDNPNKKPCGYNDARYIVSKIKSIENIGTQIVYNLSAVASHTYLVNNIITHNTSGDNESDFSSMQELMYNPDGYNIKGISNVYDKEGQGRKRFTYFYPGYLNRADCYDKDGNSDVTKALLEILKDRYKVKYNSTDINAITKRIAEIPITPQEAIQRSRGNIFPITELTQRLNEIDNNPNFFDDVYVGTLVINSKGTIDFSIVTDSKPIRDFPTKDNKISGALEIYEMPQKVQNAVPRERYIVSLDNYENDESNTMSLGSIFVLDLWTDRIVAEYTGRPMYVDDLNELARKVCIFYNAKLLYENNKKNTFSYFSRMNSLHLLADTPEYLKNKQLIKSIGYGNTSKGVNATLPIKNFGFNLIRDWLLKPVTISKEEDGNVVEYTVPNLHFIKNRALIKELMLYNPAINVDRIMSLVQLMLYREEKMILYKGDMTRAKKIDNKDYLGDDPFFSRNYRPVNLSK